MERTYLPVLLLLGFVLLNAVIMLGLSALTMRSRPTAVKQQAYESGIPALGDARERFSVKFYMVAVLFIIFDIETVFMIPWGAYYQQLSCKVPLVNGLCANGQLSFFGLGEMLVFMDQDTYEQFLRIDSRRLEDPRSGGTGFATIPRTRLLACTVRRVASWIAAIFPAISSVARAVWADSAFTS